MIIVRVELHSAVTGKVTEIARAVIANKGTGTATKGNYIARVVAGRTSSSMEPRDIVSAKPFRTGEVYDYPRKSIHIWNLVARALKSMNFN